MRRLFLRLLNVFGLTVWRSVETVETVRDGWVYREITPGSHRRGIGRTVTK